MRNTAKALAWIAGVLNRNNVPFQVQGGLAAIAYGATRKLMDIDINIPGRYFKKITPGIRPYVTKPLRHAVHEGWDLRLVELYYKGQKIELCDSDNPLLWDKKKKKWVKQKTPYSRSAMKRVFGTRVPIMPKKELIAYKKILARGVDFKDIEQISNKKRYANKPYINN